MNAFVELKKNDCLRTPHWVYSRLGEIDLDPCAGVETDIAKNSWAIERGENGLQRKWEGFVFCNPPFSQKELWAQKMAEHGNGILLLPERHSAPWFIDIARESTAHFVFGIKINFEGGSSSNPDGSVMFLFGDEAVERILKAEFAGMLITSFASITRAESQYQLETNS